MKMQDYQQLRAAVIDAGYGHEIAWAQNVTEPPDPVTFASEAIWVILCSGMKAQVARIIQERVWKAINDGKPVKGHVLGRSGKAAAIDTIWRDRESLFHAFRRAQDKLAFCATLPWIGPITKFHLAKNLGVDCAKPDIHLERVAAFYSTTPADLCAQLAAATGDRMATVDMVIWRACNLEIIQSRTLLPGAYHR
jgi:hypothetical protein